MTTREGKTAMLPIRFTPTMLERLRKAAADDDRDVSDWVRLALGRALDALDDEQARCRGDGSGP